MKIRIYILVIIAILATCFVVNEYWNKPQPLKVEKKIIHKAKTIISNAKKYSDSPNSPFYNLRTMLYKDAPTLKRSVLNKVLVTLECANDYNITHNNIVTVIDYSLPSNQKRLWVIDLNNNKLLYHTYVSHGIKSGFLLTNNFSNQHNSKASSIGVYRTEKVYYGKEGISLRLEGLEGNFNDHAYSRSIVMHGGWYMDEGFIKKYGRAGRSWGCTAIPDALTHEIINTIKDQSFFVVYYPNEQWLLKSRFLHCKNATKYNDVIGPINLTENEREPRDKVLFLDLHVKRAEDKPILMIASSHYQNIFNTSPPLTRMIRRQVNNVEYIALNNLELQKLVIANKNGNVTDGLDIIKFAVPELKMYNGNYITQMKMVSLGKIQNITWSNNLENYSISFTNQTLHANATGRFIRWLGL